MFLFFRFHRSVFVEVVLPQFCWVIVLSLSLAFCFFADVTSGRQFYEVDGEGHVISIHPKNVDSRYFELAPLVEVFNEWFFREYVFHMQKNLVHQGEPTLPKLRVHPPSPQHLSDSDGRLGVVAVDSIQHHEEYLRVPIEMILGRESMMKVSLFQFLFDHCKMFDHDEQVSRQSVKQGEQDDQTFLNEYTRAYSAEIGVNSFEDDEHAQLNVQRLHVEGTTEDSNLKVFITKPHIDPLEKRDRWAEKQKEHDALKFFVKSHEFALVCFLLYEKFHPNGSYWKPYLDLLPAREELLGLLRYSEREIEQYYRNTSFPERYMADRERIHFEFEIFSTVIRISDRYTHRIPFGFPHGEARSFEQFEWAYQILHTREIWWDAGPHLVPMLDFINCRAVRPSNRDETIFIPVQPHRTWISKTHKSSVAVTRAARAFEKGEEVTENYGQSNSYYLYNHGFFLELNPVHDCAILHRGLLPEELLRSPESGPPSEEEVERDNGYLSARLQVLLKVLGIPMDVKNHPHGDPKVWSQVTICVSPHVEHWRHRILPVMRIHALNSLDEIRTIAENPHFTPYSYFSDYLERRAYESLILLVQHQRKLLEETLSTFALDSKEAYYYVWSDENRFAEPLNTVSLCSSSDAHAERIQKKITACRYIISQIHLLHIVESEAQKAARSIDSI